MSASGGVAAGVAVALASRSEEEHGIEFYVVRVLIVVLMIAIPSCVFWLDWRKKRKK